MKKLLSALLYIFFCFTLSICAHAANVEQEQSEALGVDTVVAEAPPMVREIIGDFAITDLESADTALSRLGDAVVEAFGGIFKRGLRSAALILIIIILCAVVRTIYDGGGTPDYLPLGAALAVGAVAAGDIGSFIGMGSETLFALSDFSKVLLPSLSTAAAASGAVTSASAKYAACALFMDVMITVGSRVIMPLIYVYIAAIIAHAALGGDTLSGATELLKWLCKTLLTLLVLAFVAYLGLTGIISGSADAVAIRVTKTAISTLLPVVGSIISDAASAVISGAAMLRNGVGIFGMLAVVCTCLSPFLTLGTHYLLYKATAGISAAVADKRLTSLISGIGTAFGMVLALVGTGAIMLFFSILSCMKAVGAS